MQRKLLPLVPVVVLSAIIASCATQDSATDVEARKAKRCTDQIIARAMKEGLPYRIGYDGSATRTNSYGTGGAVSAMVFSSQSVSIPYVDVPALDGPRPGATWSACMDAPA
ncbi:hypothetical protein GCM10007301_39100 [Azorhizobium oxalatiphilum]|uniref:Lipoprotein n=1 Tax=Azorhizobium oxalatiphilum TaxID=980631 RepID=A0A917C878_9HYPH|nr:hypothetical protein [Azorhizobium oxalatiphilum]GGF75385.1 hypothetical protein GCM10007301_39100 [Azorhizobium oxalatiphilum]